jgi:hypothetical protein
MCLEACAGRMLVNGVVANGAHANYRPADREPFRSPLRQPQTENVHPVQSLA